MAENETRTPDQIETNISRVRAKLDSTLDSLEQRLQPGELVRDAFDYLRDTDAARYMVSAGLRAGRVARDHPTPMAIAGVGILALLAWRRWHESAPVALAEPEHVSDRISAAVEAAREKLREARDSISGKAHDTMKSATRTFASDMADGARHRFERAQQGAMSMAQERRAMTVGIIGLSLVALAAAASYGYQRRHRGG